MNNNLNKWSTNQFMSANNFEIHRFYDKTLEPSPMHTHEYFELYYFVRGNIDITIEKGHYRLIPGDILLISPKNFHKTEISAGNTGYERIVLRLSPKYLQSLSSEKTDLSSCFFASSQTGKHLIRNETVSSVVLRYMNELANIRGVYGEDVLCEVKIKLLLVTLGSFFHNGEETENEDSFIMNSDVVVRAVEYINENLNGDLSLDSLAEETFFSKFHLARLFKQEMGLTPHQYILKKRLLLSRSLIESGMKINEVYVNCGFGDYTHFFRCFKDAYGMTPKEYYELIHSQIVKP